mgnify:CR=1 FL=1
MKLTKKEIIDNLFIAFSFITVISVDSMVSFSLFGPLAGLIVFVANLLPLPMFLITTFDESLRNPKESFAYGIEYIVAIDAAIIYTYSIKYLPQVMLATSLILVTLLLYWLRVRLEEVS